MKSETENYKVLERVAATFSQLSDANRLMILQILKEEEHTVTELVELTGLKQPAVSKHLGVMYRGNLLSRRKDGNKTYYQVSNQVIFDLCHIVCDKLKQEQSELAEISFEL